MLWNITEIIVLIGFQLLQLGDPTFPNDFQYTVYNYIEYLEFHNSHENIFFCARIATLNSIKHKHKT